MNPVFGGGHSTAASIPRIPTTFAIACRDPGRRNHDFRDQSSARSSQELGPAVVPLLRVIQLLNKKIMEMKKRLESVAAENYPEVSKLQQVSGAGVLTAATFVLTLEDPCRFKSSIRRRIARAASETAAVREERSRATHQRGGRSRSTNAAGAMSATCHLFTGAMLDVLDRMGLLMEGRGSERSFHAWLQLRAAVIRRTRCGRLQHNHATF